jgi:AbrB family looped-hinge helix DNA binding protein
MTLFMPPLETKLSSKGQVVIPREIREKSNLAQGQIFRIETTSAGILLRPVPLKKKGLRLEDLQGFFNYTGKPVLDEKLFEPIDYSKDWGRKVGKRT